MVKLITSALFAGLMVFSLTGCGDAKKDFGCKVDNVDAPEWVCNGEDIEGSIVATGSAPKSKLGMNFTKNEAMAAARSALALAIQADVKTKVEQFARSTGVGDAETADKVSTQVSKQIAKIKLKGTKRLKTWNHPQTGEMFVLMGVPVASVNEETKKLVKTSYKNDEALYQQFVASKALDKLDAEFPAE